MPKSDFSKSILTIEKTIHENHFYIEFQGGKQLLLFADFEFGGTLFSKIMSNSFKPNASNYKKMLYVICLCFFCD